MDSVLLHLERLNRHYTSAFNTYDRISLLDLSHTLRMWTDLKNVLPEIASAINTSRVFKNATLSRKVRRSAKGYKYIFAYIAGEVITRASSGNIAAGPTAAGIACTIGAKIRITANFAELGSFFYINKVLNEQELNFYDQQEITNCNYLNCLGAEVGRISDFDDKIT